MASGKGRGEREVGRVLLVFDEVHAVGQSIAIWESAESESTPTAQYRTVTRPRFARDTGLCVREGQTRLCV